MEVLKKKKFKIKNKLYVHHTEYEWLQDNPFLSFRSCNDMTQKELADSASLSTESIRKFERGFGNPNSSSFHKLATSMNVDFYELRGYFYLWISAQPFDRLLKKSTKR